MSQITVHAGDNRESLRRLIDQGVRVHSVVTDPPYSLTSIVKRFGKDGAAPAKFGRDGAFTRASAGFMGLQWDATGIEYDPEFWALIYEILLPGGFVFAFSSPRTGHRQACAMEMVGFIMHPFHGWVYGSGMPKAHNPCPTIDKLMGAEGGFDSFGETVRRIRPGADQNRGGSWEKLEDREYERGRYVPTSPEAQQWDGWRYGTQTQKPAMEPIYLAQKPYSEKTGTANLLKHGVGAFNIDGCRVPAPGETITTHSRGEESAVSKGIYGDSRAQETHQTSGQTLGRWPANLLHDGSDDVVALFPDSKGQQGDVRGTEPSLPTKDIYGQFAGRVPSLKRNDEGSAARFFNSFPRVACETCCDNGWVVTGQTSGNPYGEQEQCPDCDQINFPTDDLPIALYQSKATKADRAGGKHPTVKPIGLLQHLVRHITPPGGTVLDPFAGSGTTAEAARREGMNCILMEAEPDYVAFLNQRFVLNSDRVPHPRTVTLDDLFGDSTPEPSLLDSLFD